jgi:hypothetical protein
MAQLLDLLDVVAPKDIRILIRGDPFPGPSVLAFFCHLFYNTQSRLAAPVLPTDCLAGVEYEG